MPRFVAGLLAGIALVAVAVQLLLPVYLEDRVADRLTEGGGNADVSLSAFPALRLLGDDGDRLEVRGSGLRLAAERHERFVERLDGFDEVDVVLEDTEVGPLELERVGVVKAEGERSYRVEAEGSARPRDLARALGSEAGGLLGEVIGGIAGEAIPGAGTSLPVSVEARLRSSGDGLDVLEARASVAGLPAGPLAGFVIAAVAERL